MTNKDSMQLSPVLCASLKFDLELGLVTNSRNESQRLSPVYLKLVTYFLAHHGKVISRTELFDAIWPNQVINDDVLTRAISDLRTQLAKLDNDTKFIETLPKRGYRWSLHPVTEVMTAEADNKNVDAATIVLPPVDVVTKNWIKNAGIYLLLSTVLAISLMLVLVRCLNPQASGVAVLPTIADRPAIEPLAQTVNEVMLNVLRKNTKVKLLSASAISSRPQNPFPYFANQFGATWVIESHVSDLDGINKVELSLVDAYTGIELRGLKFDINNRADASQKIAQKIEFDLLIDPLSY